MPIWKDEKGYYHWGHGHGKFKTRKGAQTQERAARASGWMGKSIIEKIDDFIINRG